MTTLYWPRETLPPRNISVDYIGRSLRGSPAASGFTQAVASDAGIWVVTYDEIPVYQGNGSVQVLLFDALSAIFEGVLYSMYVPIYNAGRRPLPNGVVDTDIDNQVDCPFSDGATFSDGSTFQSSFITTKVGAVAAARDTTITITKIISGTISPGHRFSINGHLYRVKTVVSQDASEAVVKIIPPLRDAVAMGDYVDFDYPYLISRLRTDGEMNLPLQFNKWSFPSVTFVEDV